MQEAMAAFDVEMDTGLYGGGAVPDFVVVVVEGRSLDSTDAMFDEFVTGLTAAGASVSGEGTSADLDGAEHRCVGVRAQGAQMGACMWQADDHAGFVLQLEGTNESAESPARDDLARSRRLRISPASADPSPGATPR